MFAERKHLDILNDHHLVVVFVEDSLVNHIWTERERVQTVKIDNDRSGSFWQRVFSDSVTEFLSAKKADMLFVQKHLPAMVC